MSRQEDFVEAGIKYRFDNGTPMALGGGHFAEMVDNMNRLKSFEAGADYGYQYAVEKACEWLAKQDLFYNVGNGGFYRNADLLVEQFKQFMEE